MAGPKTIFQRISDYFSPEYSYSTITPQLAPPEQDDIAKQRELLQRREAEFAVEMQRSKELERQQQAYLNTQNVRAGKNKFDRHTYFQYNRIALYFELEQMEQMPEISAALDLYAEESIAKNEFGKMLTVKSSNPRVTEVLEDLFYNRIDLEAVSYNWIRDLCKYGEIYFHRDMAPGKGITNLVPVPGIELEINIVEKDNKKVFVYTHTDVGQKYSYLEMWHIKLVGDTRYSPYGVSMLDKARRIFNQLRLAEDAMLVYRAVRAPERRLFKVNVGNTDPKDIWAFVQEFRNKIKSDSVVDSKNGNVDLRSKFLSVDQDYFIPVRDSSPGSIIETLPGASNLNEIADIEYLQRKLFTALRIPKAYLNFESPQGDGKSLAMQDLRFSRTIVNKIQLSFIAGLNELAQIHLMLLGMEDELNNFRLFMTNPSTQQEIVKLEVLEKRIGVYNAAVSDPTSGSKIPAYSVAEAQKIILGKSDDEIIHGLQQQRLERAVAADLEQTGAKVKSTHIFDKIDAKMELNPVSAQTQTQGGGDGLDFDMSAGGFGSDTGFDSFGGGEPAPMGGDLGGGAPPLTPTTPPVETPPEEPLKTESFTIRDYLNKESDAFSAYKEMLGLQTYKNSNKKAVEYLTETFEKIEDKLNKPKFHDPIERLIEQLEELTEASEEENK